jgi:hypothetical protein
VAAEPYFRGQTYAVYDLSEQVLPWRVFMAWCLERGELGIWNPFLARGYDHLAEGQAAVRCPPQRPRTTARLHRQRH